MCGRGAHKWRIRSCLGSRTGVPEVVSGRASAVGGRQSRDGCPGEDEEKERKKGGKWRGPSEDFSLGEPQCREQPPTTNFPGPLPVSRLMIGAASLSAPFTFSPSRNQNS